MIVDVAFGFLGSGKTTFITKVLNEWGADEKIVVLVNEFGDVGIDGDLLAAQGGNVVELSSGCICCTLQSDFRNQIFEINHSLKPDRIIIEPSGVATISTLDWILKAQALEPVIDKINKVLIVDATSFKSLYKANRRFVESQVEGAHLVVLNKCDRVNKRSAMLIQSAISSINPDIMVLTAEFCAINWHTYQQSLANTATAATARLYEEPKEAAFQAESDSPPESARLPEETVPPIAHIQESVDALGYESFGRVYSNRVFDPEQVETFFQRLIADPSGFGDIIRAKGIFCVGKKWMVAELASREVSTQPIRPFQHSKVTIIGKNLNRESLDEALEQCGAKVARR